MKELSIYVIRVAMAALALLVLSTASWAQNKVVVIPMADDEKNTVVVAKQNGDFTDPVAAMASITATEGNPYLLFIAPGVYDLGSQQLVMKEYVEIAGSGQNSTILRGTISAGLGNNAALVVGANNASIRDLTIEKLSGGSSYSIGINNDGTSPTVSNITIVLSSDGSYEYAINNDNSSSPIVSGSTFTMLGTVTNTQTGIANRDSSNTTISNSTFILSGSVPTQRGIYNTGSSSSTVSDSTITMSGASTQYGVININSSSFANIDNSIISASTNSVFASTGSGPTETTISNSILTGSVFGDPICSFTFSDLGVDLTSDCTP